MKYTIAQKKQMLIDAINLSYKAGSNATHLVGQPLSYYNFDAVLELIKELNNDNIEQGGDDFFEYYENYPNQLTN